MYGMAEETRMKFVKMWNDIIKRIKMLVKFAKI